ncbi:hypothetical protein J8J27_34405, partial [Mycobacterium tuberculosis]|nr:hypothetical protein [Mycobacterium tuberculosis]
MLSFLFFKPYEGSKDVKEAPATMLIAIGVLAAAIVVGGLAPTWQLDVVGKVGAAIAARGNLAPAVLPNLVMA